MADEGLSRSEKIRILTRIAREGSDGNRIRAIATLLRLEEGEDADVGDLERLIQTK